MAMIATSAGLIFARLALMQELNPFFWGAMAMAVYAGPPMIMISRGAGWIDLPWIWLSSFVGLFLLFIAQSVVAHRKRFGGRGPAPAAKGKPRKKKKRKPRPEADPS